MAKYNINYAKSFIKDYKKLQIKEAHNEKSAHNDGQKHRLPRFHAFARNLAMTGGKLLRTHSDSRNDDFNEIFDCHD